jgi:hypothetical protein
MLQEAKHAGLLVDATRAARVLGRSGKGYAAPDPCGIMHKSLKGFWRLAEFVPKKRYDPTSGRVRARANFFARRVIPAASLIHEAAYQRGGGYKNQLPGDGVQTSTLADPVLRDGE